MNLRIAVKQFLVVRMSVVSRWIARVVESKETNVVFFCGFFFSKVEWTDVVESKVLNGYVLVSGSSKRCAGRQP